ncbi:MAG: type II toxin-antitoxin system prevent-host-death family antitoxin [Thermodesulfobacteriota bacterium]
MHIVGVRELKNRLTHYLSLTRRGMPVIVTDRNEPIAVLHALDKIEKTAGTEERLASLAHAKRLRMPTDLSAFRPVRRAAGGKKASELIIEERR